MAAAPSTEVSYMNYRYMCGHCGRESVSRESEVHGLACPYCKHDSLVHLPARSDVFEFGAVVCGALGFIIGRFATYPDEPSVPLIFGLSFAMAIIGGAIHRSMAR